jgi:sugar transferase (PEP-CTERM/EpsH1 system associated)
MKILFLTARFPYPPLKGDQVRSYNQIRLLARSHRITLLSFAGAQVSEQHRQQMAAYCEQVITLPLNRAGLGINLLRTFHTAYPLQTMVYHTPRMHRTLHTLLRGEHFDLAHVQLARMAPYLEAQQQIPRVLDFIDALSFNMERRYRRERGPLRYVAYAEWQRLRRYERALCQAFDQAIISSPLDRAAIGDYANLHVVTNGLDLDRFPFSEAPRQQHMIIFTGNMSYFPNVNAAIWFAHEVLPLVQQRVPEAQFLVVGANPHPDIQKLARQNAAVKITGYVENVHAYLSQATIAIAPMRSGSGMQFKTIEAMASGTPLVVTPYALGGLDAQDGEHLLVADDATTFARQVVNLLNDAHLQRLLAHNARCLIEKSYPWERLTARLEGVYHLALACRRTSDQARAGAAQSA